MLVAPDSTTRVAASEAITLELEADASIDSATLRPRFGGEQGLPVDDNAIELPVMKAPDLLRIDWKVGGETMFCTYCEVVSRHYFPLDALKGYGEGQDDFDTLSEEELFQARQAATEVIERNALRSFVTRIGRTKDYGRGSYLQLDHNDVRELLTEGYRLESDCQATRTACQPFPCWVEYICGLATLMWTVPGGARETGGPYMRDPRHPRHFTDEFKRQIVDLYNAGKPKREIMDEYDLGKSTVERWIKSINATGSPRAADNRTPEQNRILELERENRRLRMEVDVLKQAALIYARK